MFVRAAAVLGLLPLVMGACATPAESPTGPATSESWRGSLAILVGARMLDEDDWDPVEDQFAVGLEAEFRPPSSPLGLEVGIAGSYANEEDAAAPGVDLLGWTGEIYGGPRLTLDLADDSVHPYVGAGVSWIGAAIEASGPGPDVSEDDSSAAGYVHGGVQVDLSHAFLIGADVRYLFGSDIELFGVSGDADYLQVAGFVGARW